VNAHHAFRSHDRTLSAEAGWGMAWITVALLLVGCHSPQRLGEAETISGPDGVTAMQAEPVDAVDPPGVVDGNITPRPSVTGVMTPVPQARVTAVLLATSSIPYPEDIAPYENMLVINEYRIETVALGADWPIEPLAPGQRIRIAQWGLLEARRTVLTQFELGPAYRLTLEPFTDHPHLLADESVTDTLDVDLDAPALYDPSAYPPDDEFAHIPCPNAGRLVAGFRDANAPMQPSIATSLALNRLPGGHPRSVEGQEPGKNRENTYSYTYSYTQISEIWTR